jgi:NAD(P)-dependent dehydrogenase (short-subunit alcohol dehydrogenase family)
MPGTVIITGGSRGIGAAVARLAGARGYGVCVNYLGNAARAAEVVDQIEESAGRAVAVQADTAREDDVVRLFEAAEATLGPLAALVNNAGIVGDVGRVEDVRADTLRRIFDVNAIGCILCAREAVRRMSTKHGGAGGAIVNLSSAAARLGGAGELVAYAASKGAVTSFTLGLAREVAREGIRVNAVVPGLMDTEMQAGRDLASIVPSVPIGRMGTADEAAEAVLWLMSDQASYVTGAVLDVTGGR